MLGNTSIKQRRNTRQNTSMHGMHPLYRVELGSSLLSSSHLAAYRYVPSYVAQKGKPSVVARDAKCPAASILVVNWCEASTFALPWQA